MLAIVVAVLAGVVGGFIIASLCMVQKVHLLDDESYGDNCKTDNSVKKIDLSNQE